MANLVSKNVVIHDGTATTWADVLVSPYGERLAELLTHTSAPAAIIIDDPHTALIAAARLARTQRDGLIVGRDRLSPGLTTLLSDSGYDLLDPQKDEITSATRKKLAVAGRISLLTSGTTGTPKLVPHRWDTLYTGRDMRRVQPRRWLLPYQPGSYAWFQVVTLGMFQADQALIPASPTDMPVLFQTAAAARVDSMSATPTFWRLALMSVPNELLRSVPFQNITLGGEAATQDILDALRVLYPDAVLTHIYATSEAGACIIVKDGFAGFSAAVLERNDPLLPQVRIVNGKLLVRSPYSSFAATENSSQWVDTGDLVEQRGDRIHFTGRDNTALINVGGNKAWPADIEAVLLSHPSIAWARVRGVRSPLVGQLPEADLVFKRDHPASSEADLAAFCTGRLPEYAIPRFWNTLAAIPVSTSLKTTL